MSTSNKPAGFVEAPTYPKLPATHAGGPTENEPFKGDEDTILKSTTQDDQGRVKFTTESGRTKVPADTSAEFEKRQKEDPKGVEKEMKDKHVTHQIESDKTGIVKAPSVNDRVPEKTEKTGK